MRNTKQKILILKIINDSFIHPSAYEIYEMCKKEIPDISLGTIYRNLNSLAHDLKIKRLKTPENVDRFDKMIPHSHFMCIICNKVIDIESTYGIDIKQIGNNKVLDCCINFNGVCEECQKKGKN